MTAEFAIACVDVGAPGNVGWAVLSGSGDFHGSDPRGFVETVVPLLERSRMAIGFECPLYVPLRDDPESLTRKRAGELGVYWSGGPGGGVLAAGIVQVRWFLSELAKRRDGIRATTRWSEFSSGVSQLFVWEAFVAGHPQLPVAESLVKYPASAGRQHERDALAGALKAKERFLRKANPDSDLREERGISLIGMHLVALSLASDLSMLNESCLVVSSRKPQ